MSPRLTEKRQIQAVQTYIENHIQTFGEPRVKKASLRLPLYVKGEGWKTLIFETTVLESGAIKVESRGLVPE